MSEVSEDGTGSPVKMRSVSQLENIQEVRRPRPRPRCWCYCCSFVIALPCHRHRHRRMRLES